MLRQSFSAYFKHIILQLTYPSLIKPKTLSWEEHLKLLTQYHTSHKQGETEYNVGFHLFNAADYGVPQVRHRVMIVGFRQDLNMHWSVPAPTHSTESLLYLKWISGDYWERHNLLRHKDPTLTLQALQKLRTMIDESEWPLLPWQTTRDAIGDLPESLSSETAEWNNHIFRAGANLPWPLWKCFRRTIQNH